MPLLGLASPAEHRAGMVNGADPADPPVWLRREFVAGPRSYGWAGRSGAPDLVVHRFERLGQRVRVAAYPEQSEWWLAPDSAKSLERAVELLSKANDALARSCACCGPPCRPPQAQRGEFQ